METATVIPTIVWYSSSLIVVACLSAIVLSIQYNLHQQQRIRLSDTPTVATKFDTQRDKNVPFVDTNRLSRLIFDSLVSTMIAALQLILFLRNNGTDEEHQGWISPYDKLAHWYTTAYTFICLAWIYATVLSFLSLRYRLPNQWGWTLNVHLFVIYVAGWIVSLYQFWRHLMANNGTEILHWSQSVIYLLPVLCGFDLVVTTGAMKQGPPFITSVGTPAENSNDMDATVREQQRQVCNINVDSIFGVLFMNWCTKVVRTVARKKGDASDNDLPILTPHFRAENIFHEFGATRPKTQVKNATGSLIFRLIRCNAKALCLQGCLALVSAWFWYIPAFFINRLLQFLQDVNDGVSDMENPMQYGFLLVVGMGASLVIAGIVSGQQWYYSSCELQTRIRTMLNVEVYRKALRRKDSAVVNIASPVRESLNGNRQVDKKSTLSTQPSSAGGGGALVNLMGTDASRVGDFAAFWFPLLSAPLEMFLGIYFLYQLIGVSCFYGLAFMIFVLPINHFNSKLFHKTQERLMKARDTRVSLMNEIVLGIRQVKFFAWENLWTEKIMETRQAELKQLKVTYINGVFFQLIFQGAPVIVTLVSFFAFTKIFGNHLTPAIAFTVINVFNELRKALNVIPLVSMQAIQAYTSIKRIQNFLNEDEIDSVATSSIDGGDMDVVGFENATVGWTRHAPAALERTASANDDHEEDTIGQSFILQDLNVKFPPNELSLISGPTGSGKTLMLLALLGEATVLTGRALCPRRPVVESFVDDEDSMHDRFTTSASSVNLQPSWLDRYGLAYVSQTPWLQNASIRDNILFGLPYFATRYQQTLSACALDKDLTLFDDGDLTEIGEKGITLSGGQKARVALARAVYSRAQIVVMDDVLSAVDAHTAKHLYEQCLLGPLMKSRTRILVTHQVKLCFPECGYLVHLANGRPIFVGTPTELRQQVNFKDNMAVDGKGATMNINILADLLLEEHDSHAGASKSVILEAANEEEAIEDTLSRKAPEDHNHNGKQINSVQKKAPRVLVEEETRASGAVKFQLYKTYASMLGGIGFWALLITITLSARGFEIGERWWIKVWAQSYSESNDSKFGVFILHKNSSIEDQQRAQPSIPNGAVHLNYYLSIYCLIALGNVIAGALRYIVLYYGSLRTNKELYANLLQRVFRAPLRFFDTTPTGRILNRFSKDFEAIDSGIPTALMIFVIQILMLTTAAITICWVLPIMILPVIIMLVLNFIIGVDYINSSRELRRLDAVKRSPLFSNFTETVAGITTIRAYGATQRFFRDMMDCIDASVRPFYYTWAVNHWVSVRSYMSSATINFIAAGFVIYNLGNMDVALAGFGLSFVLTFTDNIFWGIRHYTNLEMNFNSIERVVEFMEIDQEAAPITTLRPPPQWPTRGQIDVQHLEVRYAPDLDPVLRGISFSIQPQEKIGVVGRTGSGKSTLALSFFRFIEASKGTIYIDGIDIKQLGTDDLRSNLTIIPQDPILFSGTLKSNMDPFGQFDDEAIFDALRRVQLTLDNGTARKNGDSTIGGNAAFNAAETTGSSETAAAAESLDTVMNANVFEDLETEVAEGGKNFSQGQRQLLCLARALLKRSRIVLMDEATASVDFETDKAIQKAIATEFVDSTIICIAHRLHTIIEYDRILVLDQGKIVEFDNPLALMTDSRTAFHKMCANSGEYESLLQLAKTKHQLVDDA